MTGTLVGVLASISASAALSIVAKVTIVLSMALLAARLCHNARASVRHAVPASAFCVSVVLPTAPFVLPAVEIRLARLDTAEWPSMTGGESGGATVGNEQDAAPPAPPMARPLLTIVSTSMAAWAIGTGVFVAPIGIGIFRRRQLRCGLARLRGAVLSTLHARPASSATSSCFGTSIYTPR